ncbi:MAG: hypothetical protein HYY17_01720 [Planctomycetes bacterium]|nr:hypothetical protein [Planctomycetota bacterium]
MLRKTTAFAAWIACMGLSAAAQEMNVEQAILDFVNDPATTSEQLQAATQHGYAGSNFDDYTAAQAAASILAHRAGWDRIYGTADDNPFDTLLELYQGTSVGTEGMEGLEIYVGKNYFALGGPSAILDLVNAKKTKVTTLKAAGLTSPAAQNIIRWRDGGPDMKVTTKKDNKYVAYSRIFGHKGVAAPVYPAHSVDDVPEVGPVSIQKLFDFAMGVVTADGGAGGYVLTEANANVFLTEAVNEFISANGENLWSTYGYGAFGGEAYTDEYSKNFFLDKIRDFLLDFGSATWGASAGLVGQTFSNEAAAREAIAAVVSGLWEQNADLWVQAYAEMIGEATP